MSRPSPEVERARRTLRMLIDLSMMSRREVERRLQEADSGADLTRLLNDRIGLEIKIRHVVGICRVLDLHPLEFCRMVFGEPKEQSPFLQRIEAVLGPLRR